MGCSDSKPENPAKDAADPDDIRIDEKTGHAITADGHRKSLTKRRVAIRAENEDFEEAESVETIFPKT